MWLTLLPTLILNYKKDDSELCRRDYLGWGLWVAGMALETIADYQKFTFRSNPANRYLYTHTHGERDTQSL